MSVSRVVAVGVVVIIVLMIVWPHYFHVDENHDGIALDSQTVLIKPGWFIMGSASKDDIYPADGESPTRNVTLSQGFTIDRTEVTNRKFAEFIRDTGHTTDAEKYGWSFVVETFLSRKESANADKAVSAAPWWAQVFGATWDRPEGSDSAYHYRLTHPVVHVSWNDATAYCNWRKGRLPTEAEWEYAARGGLEQKRFTWGDDSNKSHLMANVFQGDFPYNNTRLDGFLGTAPVGSFPANGYGLFDMSGNVWEWTNDWFSLPQGHAQANPTGPKHGDNKVCKGGSFMCHKRVCYRYRNAARTKNTPDTTTYNIGFRCVY